MKNKILSIVLAFVFISFIQNSVFAVSNMPQKEVQQTIKVEDDDTDCDESDIITKVTFRDKFKKAPEEQIKTFFKKYNKYSTKNDIEKLKPMYADDYINNDGFDKEAIFKMMSLSTSEYKDISYSTEIENIKVEGNYAVVNVHETAKGETIKSLPKLNDTGVITSDIYYTDYLRKEGNGWVITGSNINNEKVYLLYGEAKRMTIDIKAPDCVVAGSNYDVSISTKSPDGVFIVGSIVNEEIVFPQQSNKDVFRSIKYDELARILTANKNNNNEYATASVALTRAQVEPASIVLNMTGIAFVMKRVNVLSTTKKNSLKEEM